MHIESYCTFIKTLFFEWQLPQAANSSVVAYVFRKLYSVRRM